METIESTIENSLSQLLTNINEDGDRDYSYLHPSEVGGCQRQVYYKAKGIQPIIPPTPRTLRIFGNGHFVHLRYQLYLRDSGILAKEKVKEINNVSCKLGLTEIDRVTISGFTGRTHYYHPEEWVWIDTKEEKDLPEFGGVQVPYTIRAKNLKVDDEIWMVEVPLFNEEYHFGGHADAIVKTPQGASVVDFKSSNDNSFAYLFHNKERMSEYCSMYPDKHFQECHICGAKIKRSKDYNDHLMEQHLDHITPDPKHKIQLHVYMWLLGVNHATLLYENKNTQEMLCMPVEKEETLIANIKNQSVNIWESILTDTPPERPYKNRSKFPCAWCDFVSHCWA